MQIQKLTFFLMNFRINTVQSKVIEEKNQIQQFELNELK